MSYSVFSDSGKNNLNIDPNIFGKTALSNGAGEILINSIDNDGSLLGFDIFLVDNLSPHLITFLFFVIFSLF